MSATWIWKRIIQIATSSKLNHHYTYMKKTIALVAAFLTFMGTAAIAQCNVDLYSEKSLSQISSGYMYSKSYRIDGKGGRIPKVEYSVIFSKDTNYQFSIQGKDQGAYGVTFKLLDAQRNEVATNFINEKHFSKITYRCKASGLYYMVFSFTEDSSNCAAAVLAFRR
jgi:hypothetical protein